MRVEAGLVKPVVKISLLEVRKESFNFGNEEARLTKMCRLAAHEVLVKWTPFLGMAIALKHCIKS